MTNDDKNLTNDNTNVPQKSVEGQQASLSDNESGAFDATLQQTETTADGTEVTADGTEVTAGQTFADESFAAIQGVDEGDTDAVLQKSVNADDVESDVRAARRKKADKVVNIVLIVAIVLLVLANLLRFYVWTDVTILQNSMQPTYDPNDKVLVAKLRQVDTSDVVVVYKYDVDKFKAYFAPATEKGDGGKYELLIKRAVAVAGDSVWTTEVATGKGTRYAFAIRKNGHTYYEFYVFDSDPGADVYCNCEGLAAGRYVLCESLDRAKSLYGEHVLQITTDKTGMLGKYTEASPLTLADNQLLLLGDNRDRSNDSRDMGLSNYGRILGVVVRQTYDE